MTEIGDYQIIKKLGEGTFSEVVQAKNKRNGKLYAMKRFKKKFVTIEDIESLREIQALRRLNHHPNIIQLEEVIYDAKFGVLSLSFELMDTNLYEVLSRKGCPPLNEQRTKWIIWQTIKALDFVHSKGIFHRDIKPENILVRGDVHAVPIPFPDLNSSQYRSVSSFPLVKLADFGSCRGIHSRMPYTGYIATRWYRSPECLLFNGIYSYKMDIWGIGCVLFEILTKIPLFPGDNELDQLHKIHGVLGSPSERLLKVMVASGTNAMVNAPNNQNNPKVAHHLAQGIFKKKFAFPPIQARGLRNCFPQHVLHGAAKVPTKPGSSQPLSPKDYPGLSDECLNLAELLLQYDPDARPTARQVLKHPWLKECRDVEMVEKEAWVKSKDMPEFTMVSPSIPISPSALVKRNTSPSITGNKIVLSPTNSRNNSLPRIQSNVQSEAIPMVSPNISSPLKKDISKTVLIQASGLLDTAQVLSSNLNSSKMNESPKIRSEDKAKRNSSEMNSQLKSLNSSSRTGKGVVPALNLALDAAQTLSPNISSPKKKDSPKLSSEIKVKRNSGDLTSQLKSLNLAYATSKTESVPTVKIQSLYNSMTKKSVPPVTVRRQASLSHKQDEDGPKSAYVVGSSIPPKIKPAKVLPAGENETAKTSIEDVSSGTNPPSLVTTTESQGMQIGDLNIPDDHIPRKRSFNENMVTNPILVTTIQESNSTSGISIRSKPIV